MSPMPQSPPCLSYRVGLDLASIIHGIDDAGAGLGPTKLGCVRPAAELQTSSHPSTLSLIKVHACE